MPLDFDHLYELADPLSNRCFRGAVRLPRSVDQNGLLTGEWRPTDPIVLGCAEGRVLADIMWTNAVGVVAISGRLATAFRSARFSGWFTYPVQIETETSTDHGYVGLTITGRSGPLDRTRGEWIRKDDEPGRFLRGLFFDERSWDGSDFFLPSGTLRMFLTERVRDCLKRERVKNIRCDRLSDVLTAEVVIRSAPGARAQP